MTGLASEDADGLVAAAIEETKNFVATHGQSTQTSIYIRVSSENNSKNKIPDNEATEQDGGAVYVRDSDLVSFYQDKFESNSAERVSSHSTFRHSMHMC